MPKDPTTLGKAIDNAYRCLKTSRKRGRAFAEHVKAQYAYTIKEVTDLLRQDADSLLSKWSKKTLESYFELAVILLLATDSEYQEIKLFKDLTRQLDRTLESHESQKMKAKEGARALLESLILAIENVRPRTSQQILELLARLSNAPEGVISPSRQEGQKNEGKAAGKTFDRADRASLRGLLQVGLYREVMVFLQQRKELSGARKNGEVLGDIRKPIVSIISRKGGVGKSMFAFATAAWYLKHVRRHATVCIVDLDLSGPVWQYLLFPERNMPSHFLNDLFRMDQGNQKGDFEFPEVSTNLIKPLLEKSTINVEGARLRLLSFADLPRTSRYLSLAIANNSQACFRFLTQVLLALQPLVDLIIIDNGPGIESLPLLSHVVATSVPHGCSAVVSTPALPDLRGTLIELSDLYVLDRDSALVKRPPVWIVNKADQKARAFLSAEHSIVDVANEIEAYNAILPDRPLVGRAVSPSKDKFHGLALPLDQDLLAFGNVKNSGTPPLQDALNTFLETRFFKNFVKHVGPEIYPFLKGHSIQN